MYVENREGKEVGHYPCKKYILGLFTRYMVGKVFSSYESEVGVR